MSSKRIAAFAAAMLGLLSHGAAAQTYPTRPIKMVVGFAPGGPSDVMARLIGQHMSAALGEPVVVENRPGAGGTIGGRIVSESEPDGYTLLLGNTSTLIVSPLTYESIGYDPVKGFTPIALLGTTSDILIANPKFPPNSIGELIAYAKARPSTLNYSSAGIGTPPHIIGEMFKQRAGLEITHVPYKGGGPAIQAVIAGEVQFCFENPATAMPQVKQGTVKALAVTSEKRSPKLPNVPTMIESGLPDFAFLSFTGVIGPAGLPAPIVARLNGVINEALKSPELARTLENLAVDVKAETPAAFGAFLSRETARLAPVIKAAVVKGE
ncbi:MAG TPA: tripartite tricarboxylate transporter substrate binding protein [Xanthobacteraceae bacterium]